MIAICHQLFVLPGQGTHESEYSEIPPKGNQFPNQSSPREVAWTPLNLHPKPIPAAAWGASFDAQKKNRVALVGVMKPTVKESLEAGGFELDK